MEADLSVRLEDLIFPNLAFQEGGPIKWDQPFLGFFLWQPVKGH
jgi:hypothetical protein